MLVLLTRIGNAKIREQALQTVIGLVLPLDPGDHDAPSMQAVCILLASEPGAFQFDDLLVIDPDEPERDEANDVRHSYVSPE